MGGVFYFAVYYKKELPDGKRKQSESKKHPPRVLNLKRQRNEPGEIPFFNPQGKIRFSGKI